jgi:hypothetical protein
VVLTLKMLSVQGFREECETLNARNFWMDQQAIKFISVMFHGGFSLLVNYILLT